MKIQKSQFDKVTKTLSGQVLSSETKQSMLADIYAANPAPALIPSPFYYNLQVWRRYSVAALATLVLIVSGGTSYAAMHSLPGDRLYAMKTEVLEPIALSVRFDAESKNAYQVTLLQKRVEEMHELERQGRATMATAILNFEATARIVEDLEASAIFTEDGENEAVSSEIRLYNAAVIDFDLRIDSNIKDTSVNATTSLPIPVEVPAPVALDLNEVLPNQVERPDPKVILEEVVEIVDPEPTLEAVLKPVTPVVNPVVNGIGL